MPLLFLTFLFTGIYGLYSYQARHDEREETELFQKLFADVMVDYGEVGSSS